MPSQIKTPLHPKIIECADLGSYSADRVWVKFQIACCFQIKDLLIQYFARYFCFIMFMNCYAVYKWGSNHRPPAQQTGALPTELTAAWLAQLVERQSAVREVYGSSPRPDQHSGS